MMDDQQLNDLVRDAFLEESWDMLRTIESTLREMRQASQSKQHDLEPDLLHGLRRKLHTLKGAASAAGISEFAEQVHAWEDDLTTVTSPLSPASVDDLFQRLESLEAQIKEYTEEKNTKRPAPTPEPEPQVKPIEPVDAVSSKLDNQIQISDTLRVNLSRIEHIEAFLGDLNVARLKNDQLVSRINHNRRTVSQVMKLYRKLNLLMRRSRRDSRNVQYESIESLFGKLGPLLSSLYSEQFSIAREAPNNFDQESSVLASLDDSIRSLRLMPLQSFFEEYDKVVRQAARQSGKQATLEVVAKGAEVDRAVLLKLRDPILHLVRNAVVHGLEHATQRKETSKPEIGTICLEAICDGSRVTISVSDDGIGIDRNSILEKAKKAGIATDLDELNTEQLLAILTRPGFSTRNRADGLSGRGVGLDVVAERLRSLDGYLALESTPGWGTCFSMSVPVSTSANLGLVLEAGGQKFGLLFDYIECVIRIHPSEIEFIQNKEVVTVNGNTVAIMPLAGLLGLEMPELSETKKPAVVLKLGGRSLAILVDDIPGEQSMIVKPLPKAFDQLKLFLGGTVMGNNEILPVLQVTELYKKASRQNQRNSLLEQIQNNKTAIKSILVVDDSITMRTLERNILKAAGYMVEIAHNGRDALEILNSQGPFDVVVTDVQMPEVDGLELCRRIRSSETPDIPIVVVTSLATDEEKQQALLAGADAYIVKAQFTQQEFLDCVGRLAG